MTEGESTAEIKIIERDDRRWWPIAVSVGSSVVSAVLAAALCLTVSNRNAQQGREQRIELTKIVCSLAVGFDDNYRAAPPGTAAGKANAVTVAAIRAGYCQGVTE